jgi:hypothetical protein
MSAVLRLLNVLRVTPDYRPASQSTSHVFTVRLADKRYGLHFSICKFTDIIPALLSSS